MAYSLETDSFLSTLIRFENRRGVPATYYSDNGTNFVGAKGELEDCLLKMDQQKIIESLSLRRVKWIFNPPGATHFGGAWESLVKSAKRALVAILSNQTLTDEVLVTALVTVENLLNGRPLTYISNDVSAPEVLTPNHLLVGRANPNMPPDVFYGCDMTSKKRWRFSQALATAFWRRWMTEFRPTMQERKKWAEHAKNLRVGDLVVLADPNNPRGHWPLGRILKTFEATDGVVRSAIVKIGSSEIHRPATKIYPLDVEYRVRNAHRAGDVPDGT